MDKSEQIKKRIAEDAAFAASLKEAKTPEQLMEKLCAEGYPVTLDDLKAMKCSDGTPLSDEELDNVAGGWWIFW